jgi:hypothetical protein
MLSDIYMYITYLLIIIIYDKDIESSIFLRVMYKEFLSGMNTHPHTEDQATSTDYFPKHLAGNLALYSLHLILICNDITIHHLTSLDSCRT